jgi:hypothetical protein
MGLVYMEFVPETRAAFSSTIIREMTLSISIEISSRGYPYENQYSRYLGFCLSFFCVYPRPVF